MRRFREIIKMVKENRKEKLPERLLKR